MIRPLSLSLVASALFGMAPVVTAQVAVMNSVPSVADLRSALQRDARAPTLAPATASASAGSELVSRGIVWGTPASNAPNPAGTAASGAAAPAAPAPGPAVALPIGFEANSARLSGSAAAYVDAIAQLLIQEPGLRLTVEGHTDASGPASRNLVLSWDRAMTVFRTLVERHGIDPMRLQPLGRGSLEPLDGTAPTAPANRRVQFRVVS